VVREEVEARTCDTASLSATFLTFAVVAALITSVAIALDSEVLLIGGMVVGPEFGPIAGLCVAAVQRRSGLTKQSAVALTAGLLAAGAASAPAGLALRATDTIESVSGEGDLATLIANPDVLSVAVALAAGVAAMLSLSTWGWRPWGSSACSTSAAGRVTCASADRAVGVRPARRTSARSADAGVLA